MSTGFKFDKTLQKWTSANFNTSGQKYLLKRDADGTMSWNDFDASQEPPLKCTGFTTAGFTVCNTACDGHSCGLFSGWNAAFNEQTLRFVLTFWGGYMDGLVRGTPAVEIGTCAAL